jgi:hypothetical protein
MIDHSTTTAEAAGHTGGNRGMGGDILYRWGNPAAYRAGTEADQKLFFQHDVQWIPDGYPGAGNLTIFSNGGGRPGGNSSSVDEVTPAVDGNGDYPPPATGSAFGPEQATWMYQSDPPTDWFMSGISGAQRQRNGNTLICSGQVGEFFEVKSDSTVVWRYINPISNSIAQEQGIPPQLDLVFRAERYPPDFPGFAGCDLTPGAALEIYPITISGTAHDPAAPAAQQPVTVTTTITGNNPITMAEVHVDTGSGVFAVPLFDDGNHNDGGAGDDLYGALLPPVATPMTVTYYIHAEDDSDTSVTDPPNPPSTVYFYTIDCGCPNQGDDEPDGFITALDLAACIDILFAGAEDVQDEHCPTPRFDLDADGFTTALDLSRMIDHLFADGPGPADPCTL